MLVRTNNLGIMRGYVASVKPGEKVSFICISVPKPRKKDASRDDKPEYDRFWLKGFYKMSEKLSEAKEVMIYYHLADSSYEAEGGKKVSRFDLVLDSLEVLSWKDADQLAAQPRAPMTQAPRPVQAAPMGAPMGAPRPMPRPVAPVQPQMQAQPQMPQYGQQNVMVESYYGGEQPEYGDEYYQLTAEDIPY